MKQLSKLGISLSAQLFAALLVIGLGYVFCYRLNTLGWPGDWRSPSNRAVTAPHSGLYSGVLLPPKRGALKEPRKAKVTTALPFDPCDLVAVNRRLALKSPRERAGFEGFFNWRVPTFSFISLDDFSDCHG
jgi:hypothetical protein